MKVILFVFLVAFSSFSQNPATDSLKLVLLQTTNDIDKVKLLNSISSEYSTDNPKLMLQYANDALKLSKKLKFKVAEGKAYQNIGNANIIIGNYTQALFNFSNAKNVFESELDAKNNSEQAEIKDGLARAYGSIGIVFSEQSNYAKALQYHLKALKIYESTNNKEKLARIYNNVGIVYKA